jgi:hypothetical protein
VYSLYQIVFNTDLRGAVILYYTVMSLLCVNWGRSNDKFKVYLSLTEHLDPQNEMYVLL